MDGRRQIWRDFGITGGIRRNFSDKGNGAATVKMWQLCFISANVLRFLLLNEVLNKMQRFIKNSNLGLNLSFNLGLNLGLFARTNFFYSN